MDVTHHTEDLSIFRELFVDGFYDLPPDWASVPPQKIIDLGGNIGMFALLTKLRWSEAELTAFEPDPANATKYRRMLELNGIEGKVIEACASTCDGELNFASGLESTSHISDEGTPVLAVDIFSYLDRVDLLKIDIEGGEWPILLDPRFTRLGASLVMLEYHPYMCPENDARRLAVQLLRGAGYEVQQVHHDDSDGVGVLRARRVG